MNPVIIIVIAFILLIPISAIAQLPDHLGGDGGGALGTEDPENYMILEFIKIILGVGFVTSPIIGIVIIVLIIRKFRKKNQGGTSRTLEEIKKEKTTKGKIWLIFAGMFWLVFLFALTQDIHGFGFYDNNVPSFAVLMMGVVFPFIGFILTFIGLVKLLKRNNLSKNEKIEQLEDRLGKLEGDEEKDSEEK